MDIDAILASQFPSLVHEGFAQTSPPSSAYNCIAWAAERTDEWWWPMPEGVFFWPPSVPRSETLISFVRAFESMGYLECSGGDLEPGFEKVAFFVANGKPTHAARQLPDGRWTSKLGKWIDISHTLPGLVGPTYGDVAAFMKRPAGLASAQASVSNSTKNSST